MSMRHGSLPIIGVLCSVLAAQGAPPDYGGEIVTVKSRDIEISYSVHQAARPIERIDLWVTADRAESWRHYGVETSGATATRTSVPPRGSSVCGSPPGNENWMLLPPSTSRATAKLPWSTRVPALGQPGSQWVTTAMIWPS